MRKKLRTKKAHKGKYAHRNSTRTSLQILQVKEKIKIKEVGKPAGLNNVQLEEPDIWSTCNKCLAIIKFLLDNGRHISFHLAGAIKKKKDENERKKVEKKIKKEQPLYDFLEYLSINHLGIPNQKLKKQRKVVFFFRDNNTPIKNYDHFTFSNQEWGNILRKIYFLLDETFYRELNIILKQIECNVSIEDIAKSLIENLKQSNNLEDISVILKNLLIQIIKTGSDFDLNMRNLLNISSNQILQKYKENVDVNYMQLINFLENLQGLFIENTNYYYYDNQYNNEQQFIDQEENYLDSYQMCKY